MGDLVRVKIEDVDLDRRRIDMSLVEVLKIHGEQEGARGEKGNSNNRGRKRMRTSKS
jgi:ribonuclease R